MLSSILKTFFRAFVLFIPVFILTNCAESTLTGIELIDESKIKVSRDTFYPTITQSSQDSSELYNPTDSSLINVLTIGTSTDPQFGDRTASISLLPTLPTLGLDFSLNTIDSVKLNLVYGGQTILNSDSNFDIEVSPLLDAMSYDSTYYLCDACVLSAPNGSLVDTTILINTSDSVSLSSDISVVPSLQVNLDKAYFETIFSDNTNLETNESFGDAFKGLLLESSASSPAVNLNFSSSSSVVAVYYRDSTDENQILFLTVGDSSPKAYEIDDINPSLGLNEVYLRSLSSDQVLVEMSSAITTYENENISKAELVIPVSYLMDTSEVLVPDFLLLLEELGSDDEDLIDDITFTTTLASYYNGTLNTDAFRLNISSYFQDLVRGEKDGILGMEPISKLSFFDRIIFQDHDGMTPPFIELTISEISN